MSLLSKLNVIEKSDTPSLTLLSTFVPNADLLSGPTHANIGNMHVGGAWGRLILTGYEKGNFLYIFL